MYIHYLAVNSRQPKDFVMERNNGLINYLFLYIKSPATLIIGGNVFTITSPGAFLISPETPFKYFPTSSDYVDNYLHFVPANEKDFLDELTFPLNHPLPISNDSAIMFILHQIDLDLQKQSHRLSLANNLQIRLLMYRVGEQQAAYLADQQTSHYDELVKVRELILQHPEQSFSTHELASIAHLSNAYFQVLYRKAFGVTCINDVIQSKIAQAKTYLSSTDLSVAEIAQELSYAETSHFIRQFKKNTGITPGAFRKRINI